MSPSLNLARDASNASQNNGVTVNGTPAAPQIGQTSDRLTALADGFGRRHIGPDDADRAEMLRALGLASSDELIDKTIPADIRLGRSLHLDAPKTETEALAELRAIANKNQVWRSYIGMGYSPCITPPVIQRNILENPGWYTASTPYQAEIAQGRLEMLLNFQTMVADLTGMDIANASLLDEGTAAAEAMSLAYGACKVKGANRFLVDEQCHPQVLEVLKTRARPLEIELVIGPWREFVGADFGATDSGSNENVSPVFGMYVQYPNTAGTIEDYRSLVEATHAAKALMIV
ncbi:MAG: glycine dehydrogenase (aminomethyl-transferring), partial [Cyanobacteria bacterium P01_H01_bin.130]